MARRPATPIDYWLHGVRLWCRAVQAQAELAARTQATLGAALGGRAAPAATARRGGPAAPAVPPPAAAGIAASPAAAAPSCAA
ncbi:MAG: hypothetical protein KJZ85_20310, partial [Rhodobacteraceae bacterium]|nr:hypothetical protein [Paracoccaceae bacterium]